MSGNATGFVIAGLMLAAACTGTAAREYELRGQVMAVDRSRQQVTIKHEDIPRFMPGMTMAFRVVDERLLEGRVAGDLVKATLVVRDRDVHLRTLERTGHAPIEGSPTMPLQVLQPGEQVADTSFVDETGTSRSLRDWRGQVLAVTFIYTRCPLPDYCPLMDRQFKAVQEGIRSDPALAGSVRLLSVSFDPRHDTPDVLSQHAAKLGADPALWHFLSGRSHDIDKFANQFGVAIMREGDDGREIVHNLRTAIIGEDGRLAATLNGSDSTPSDVIAEVRRAGGGRGPR